MVWGAEPGLRHKRRNFNALCASQPSIFSMLQLNALRQSRGTIGRSSHGWSGEHAGLGSSAYPETPVLAVICEGQVTLL